MKVSLKKENDCQGINICLLRMCDWIYLHSYTYSYYTWNVILIVHVLRMMSIWKCKICSECIQPFWIPWHRCNFVTNQREPYCTPNWTETLLWLYLVGGEKPLRVLVSVSLLHSPWLSRFFGGFFWHYYC